MSSQTLNLRRARSHRKASEQPDIQSLEEAATFEILATICTLAKGVRQGLPYNDAARDVLLLIRAYREFAAY